MKTAIILRGLDGHVMDDSWVDGIPSWVETEKDAQKWIEIHGIFHKKSMFDKIGIIGTKEECLEWLKKRAVQKMDAFFRADRAEVLVIEKMIQDHTILDTDIEKTVVDIQKLNKDEKVALGIIGLVTLAIVGIASACSKNKNVQ